MTHNAVFLAFRHSCNKLQLVTSIPQVMDDSDKQDLQPVLRDAGVQKLQLIVSIISVLQLDQQLVAARRVSTVHSLGYWK